MADPNLQNVPKELPEGGFDLRRCFVPSPGFVFLEFDYEAMEFRLMLDYAGETGLIDAIKRGLDPHQATADLTDLTRKSAKTLNFGLLYGMGVTKLAAKLEISEDDARKFRAQYFENLPRVQAFINQATQTAKVRGNVFNWMGRTYQFPDPNFAYKAANALIQGGCADIVRKAMVEVARQIPNFGARLLLQVHDSLLLEVPKDTAPLIVPLVKRVMEEAYVPRSLPMSVKVEIGEESWGSLRPYEETRDEIQGTDRVARLAETAQCMV
jgi:DNA polymerase-1